MFPTYFKLASDIGFALCGLSDTHSCLMWTKVPVISSIMTSYVAHMTKNIDFFESDMPGLTTDLTLPLTLVVGYRLSVSSPPLNIRNPLNNQSLKSK